MSKNKVIYYSDELNDEFSSAKIKTIPIDKDYKYYHKGFIYRITSFFWYRIVALPIAVIFMKFKHHHKVVGKKKFKQSKGQGIFIFGNHTNPGMDAVVPTLISFPRKVYIIVHPDNVSIKGLKHITPKLGAIPLPDDMGATKNFIDVIEKRIKEHRVMAVYPEAHIWPYYTDIRPFKADSFRYPVKMKTPTYSFTNTYQKRKFSKKPKVVTYIDGPFFPDTTLPKRDQEQQLRDMVYNSMKENAKKNTVEVIKYIKKEK